MGKFQMSSYSPFLSLTDDYHVSKKNVTTYLNLILPLTC